MQQKKYVKEINEGLDARLNSYVNVLFLIATANCVVHLCFYCAMEKIALVFFKRSFMRNDVPVNINSYINQNKT